MTDRRFLVISGLSGAGKTVVLNSLEDAGFYCIDNLPVSLLDHLIQQWSCSGDALPDQIAIGIDARAPAHYLAGLPQQLSAMRRQEPATELVFLDASDDVLTQRYSETRRKHPLSRQQFGLSEAIVEERDLLAELAEAADLRIDTSRSAVHDLRELVRDRIARRPEATLSLQFISFGYKNGSPRDADFVFDTRCLPNPYWQKTLRRSTGSDQAVVNYLDAQPEVQKMYKDICSFLEYWVPRFEKENRSYLDIALGCTGGQHRSVYLADKLARYFRKLNKQVILKHRDL